MNTFVTHPPLPDGFAAQLKEQWSRPRVQIPPESVIISLTQIQALVHFTQFSKKYIFGFRITYFCCNN